MMRRWRRVRGLTIYSGDAPDIGVLPLLDRYAVAAPDVRLLCADLDVPAGNQVHRIQLQIAAGGLVAGCPRGVRGEDP